jgi:phosphotransacetylase
MTTLREAAEQALEALESADWYIEQVEMLVYSSDDTGTHEVVAKVQAASATLRAALAEPQQEPVAWMYVNEVALREKNS